MSSIKVRLFRYISLISTLATLAWLSEKGKRANGSATRLPVSGEDNDNSPFTNEPLGGQAQIQAAGSGAMEVDGFDRTV